MAAPKQAGFWDVDLTTPELQAAVEVLEEHREARKAYNAAHRQLKEAIAAAYDRIIDTVGADAYEAGGARVHIAGWTAVVGKRAGGSIEIEPWELRASLLSPFERISPE